MAVQTLVMQVLHQVTGAAQQLDLQDPGGLTKLQLAGAVLATSLVGAWLLEKMLLKPVQVGIVMAGMLMGWYVLGVH